MEERVSVAKISKLKPETIRAGWTSGTSCLNKTKQMICSTFRMTLVSGNVGRPSTNQGSTTQSRFHFCYDRTIEHCCQQATREQVRFWKCLLDSRTLRSCWRVPEQSSSGTWAPGVSVRCEGRGGVQGGVGTSSQDSIELTDPSLNVSACLHGDTFACPSSRCHLFRCNTTG